MPLIHLFFSATTPYTTYLFITKFWTRPLQSIVYGTLQKNGNIIYFIIIRQKHKQIYRAQSQQQQQHQQRYTIGVGGGFGAVRHLLWIKVVFPTWICGVCMRWECGQGGAEEWW